MYNANGTDYTNAATGDGHAASSASTRRLPATRSPRGCRLRQRQNRGRMDRPGDLHRDAIRTHNRQDRRASSFKSDRSRFRTAPVDPQGPTIGRRGACRRAEGQDQLERRSTRRRGKLHAQDRRRDRVGRRRSLHGHLRRELSPPPMARLRPAPTATPSPPPTRPAIRPPLPARSPCVGTTNPGPTIGSVAVSQTKGKISWNAVDSDGVAGCTLTIDNANVSSIGGPYAATSGVNFSAPYGSLGCRQPQLHASPPPTSSATRPL